MYSFCVYMYNQSLTTVSGSRIFGSVVTAFDFCPGGPGFKSCPGRVIFSYAIFLFDIRWGFCFAENWLPFIINDLPEMGGGGGVRNICIKQIMHSFCVYNQSLTTASGSQPFGTVVSALYFCLRGPGFKSCPGQVTFSYALFFFVTAFMS